eukprot:2846319-Rhodomonas_salina.1
MSGTEQPTRGPTPGYSNTHPGFSGTGPGCSGTDPGFSGTAALAVAESMVAERVLPFSAALEVHALVEGVLVRYKSTPKCYVLCWCSTSLPPQCCVGAVQVYPEMLCAVPVQYESTPKVHRD